MYPLNAVTSLVVAAKLYSYGRQHFAVNWPKTVYAAVAAAFLLVLLIRDFSSPATDVICAALSMYLLHLLFVSTAEHNPQQRFYNYLMVALVWLLISYKLSTVPLLLVPLLLLYRHFSPQRLLAFAGIGLLLVLPYFWRNYYLSGWLVFPFPAIDLFAPVWKVPVQQVADIKQITEQWARLPNVPKETYDALSTTEWLGYWYRQWKWKIQLLLWANLLLVPLALLQLKKPQREPLFLYLILIANLLFWFFTAPDTRFVYGPLAFGAAVVAAAICSGFTFLQLELKVQRSWFGVLLLGLLVPFIIYTWPFFVPAANNLFNWVQPVPLPRVQLQKQLSTNFEYFVPVKGNRCYNMPLPCLPKPLLPNVFYTDQQFVVQPQ